MDLIAGGEGVEVLGLVEIPEHGGTVLATGGAEGSVGGDGDGVDVAGVTDVVGLETAGSELPNLDANKIVSVDTLKECQVFKENFFPILLVQ